MSSPSEAFDEKFVDLIHEAAGFDLESDEATKAIRNLETFSHCRPPAPEPEPEPRPVPTTVWEKIKAGVSCVWESETTRVVIRSGGAFIGVALVAYSTIHKDQVLEKQALAQANQRQI